MFEPRHPVGHMVERLEVSPRLGGTVLEDKHAGYRKPETHSLAQTRPMGLPDMPINWGGLGGQLIGIHGIHGVSG